MQWFKWVTTLISVFALGLCFWQLEKHGMPSITDGDFFLLVIILWLPLSCLYLLHIANCQDIKKEDNIATLWLKLRKAKMREQLRELEKKQQS